METAIFYRRLTTLREDVPLSEELEDLEWQGADERLKQFCLELEDENTPSRVTRWRASL